MARPPSFPAKLILMMIENKSKYKGRPKMYGEETFKLQFRVPISHKESIKRIVKEYLNKLKK